MGQLRYKVEQIKKICADYVGARYILLKTENYLPETCSLPASIVAVLVHRDDALDVAHLGIEQIAQLRALEQLF